MSLLPSADNIFQVLDRSAVVEFVSRRNRVLGWSMPPRVLELCVEFRNHIWNARARISVEDWATANRCAEFVTVASTDLQKALTMKIPLPRPRPPLRDTVGENPVVPISAFRQQHGEGPVAISGVLTRIAQEQANAMAARDLLDHVLLAPFAHRMGRSRFKRGAENIAFGRADFAGTLKQWTNSSGHRANLLLRGAKWIGVARASNARRTYWAMVIGGD